MASADRRAAARLLYERSDADPEWIAAAMGVEPGWLAQLIARENWRRRAADMTTTIDRLMRHVSAQLKAFEEDGETTGKARLDALLAITRTFDKLAEMRRGEEARAGGEGDDRALVEARRTVERRVGELAGQRAETIIEHLEAANGGAGR